MQLLHTAEVIHEFLIAQVPLEQWIQLLHMRSEIADRVRRGLCLSRERCCLAFTERMYRLAVDVYFGDVVRMLSEDIA